MNDGDDESYAFDNDGDVYDSDENDGYDDSYAFDDDDDDYCTVTDLLCMAG